MASVKGKSSRQNENYREHMTIENVLLDDIGCTLGAYFKLGTNRSKKMKEYGFTMLLLMKELPKMLLSQPEIDAANDSAHRAS